MDGLCRCVAAPVDIELSGCSFWIQPLNLFRLGIIEQHILAERRTTLELASEMVEENGNNPILTKLIIRASEDLRAKKEMRVVPVDDLQKWINEKNGIIFTMWLCLFDGEMNKTAFKSLKETREFSEKLSQKDLVEFLRRRDIASGTGLLGNFDWPAAGESKSKFIPWKKIFREFAEGWNWDKEMVGKMTLYELKMYRTDEAQVKGLENRRNQEELTALGIKPRTEKAPNLRERLIAQGKFKPRNTNG